MFAGIVESTARVKRKEVTGSGATLVLQFPFGITADLVLGASIALNGVCLTIVDIKSVSAVESELTFEAINETLRKTNLGNLEVFSRVNFERSITAATRIDGHFVSGHVDDVARLIEKQDDGFSTILSFTLPAKLAPFVAPKGSITINGVALTVGEVTNDSFSVYIIPHTAHVTNLGALDTDDAVNIEIDMIARYVVNYFKVTGQHGR